MSDGGIAAKRAARESEAIPCPAGCATGAARIFDLAEHAVVRCAACGIYELQLRPEKHDAFMLDRTQFEGAFRPLRLANYARILRRLARLTPLAGRKLLDVGCSNGWFIEAARAAGCECYGIEPDAFFFGRIRQVPAAGVRVVQGFFPRDLPADWGPFDFITFNDVFEHLPEPAAVLRACRERLAAGGHVVLSLPVADGFVFRLARLLHQLGIAAPLTRVFQVRYPYPHLFYYSRRGIAALARRAGFEPVRIERLRSFSLRGALHRARMDRAEGGFDMLTRYAGAAALPVFAVVEHVLPADNVLAILPLKAT